jgi:ribosomal protein S18 acetylase RimI-like enzyme
MTLIRSATPDDVDACGRVLALAFQDDPGTIVVDPDPVQRAAVLPTFFRSFVAASIAEDADIVVAGDPIQGIACWFGPERHGPSPDAMGANGFGQVLEQWGREASERLIAMVGELESQHARLAPEPHLRLQFFGVVPDHQRTGIGSALIDHGHQRADELAVPTYLDTFTEQNVRYYERRGYRVVGEFAVGAGVPVFGLLRPAAAGNS